MPPPYAYAQDLAQTYQRLYFEFGHSLLVWAVCFGQVQKMWGGGGEEGSGHEFTSHEMNSVTIDL